MFEWLSWQAIKAFFGKALSAILSLITRYPLQCAIAALLIACAWLWRADNRHIAQRDEALATITQMKADNAKAEKAAQVELRRIINERKEQANAADKVNDNLRVVYRDRVLRLPSVSAPACHQSADGLAESGDRSGADTFVSISRTDALICGDNTARLVAIHDMTGAE